MAESNLFNNYEHWHCYFPVYYHKARLTSQTLFCFTFSVFLSRSLKPGRLVCGVELCLYLGQLTQWVILCMEKRNRVEQWENIYVPVLPFLCIHMRVYRREADFSKLNCTLKKKFINWLIFVFIYSQCWCTFILTALIYRLYLLDNGLFTMHRAAIICKKNKLLVLPMFAMLNVLKICKFCTNQRSYCFRGNRNHEKIAQQWLSLPWYITNDTIVFLFCFIHFFLY